MRTLNPKLFSKHKRISSKAQFNQNSLNCILTSKRDTHDPNTTVHRYEKCRMMVSVAGCCFYHCYLSIQIPRECNIRMS